MKNYIGVQSETVVRVALEEMRSQEKILGFEQRDLPGIDFFVTLSSGIVLPLQVKSSTRNGKKHRHRYPDIPVVITKNHPGNAVKRNGEHLKPSAMVRLVRRVRCQLEEILSGNGNGSADGNGNGHH